MRKAIRFNEDWLFSLNTRDTVQKKDAVRVNLPHTWNMTDGQDGGNDYFRGSCLYTKSLSRSMLPEADEYYLEFRGANSSAEVYVNKKKVSSHDGGYSTFRVNITDTLDDENEIAVIVDNSPNDRVYPQMADFTFYGGLYRDVYILAVNSTHFDLDYYGAPGIKITPRAKGNDWDIETEVFVTNQKSGDEITVEITDAGGRTVGKAAATDGRAVIRIENAHRWHGIKDPYLYTLTARVTRDGKELDSVYTRFGCREFVIDPERGFILNGEEYPLRGVSRHQDRLGIGNALLPEHHEEDIELIMELGATTVRLAHYQHDQYFYDLCDERGLVIWAEIPYISKHMTNGRENTISQMTELIAQNYNHPSIVVWGLSNEISMNGSSDELIENHKALNELAHEMDKTRPTTVACVTMAKTDDPYVHISDVVSYNHYFGWYGGDTSMNGPWFDKFHAEYPNKPIGCSEYGCEALNWHTSNPTQGDYTEEYQAYYHEELIKQLFSRKYLWATHVWNMFDFGADARAEGGENGQNHKGLVTFDRKYKKDAFYAYKAWLSDEPFVHICGKRYTDRVENPTRVTVYSNMSEVELFANGKSLGKLSAPDHFFYFDVPNEGETRLEAISGKLRDESVIRKVDKMREDYILKEKGAVLNWFDIEAPAGRFSLNDKISDILDTEEGRRWFAGLSAKLGEAMNSSGESGQPAGFTMNEEMTAMLGGFTVLRFTSMIGMMNVKFDKETLLGMNEELNKIEKPKKDK